MEKTNFKWSFFLWYYVLSIKHAFDNFNWDETNIKVNEYKHSKYTQIYTYVDMCKCLNIQNIRASEYGNLTFKAINICRCEMFENYFTNRQMYKFGLHIIRWMPALALQRLCICSMFTAHGFYLDVLLYLYELLRSVKWCLWVNNIQWKTSRQFSQQSKSLRQWNQFVHWTNDNRERFAPIVCIIWSKESNSVWLSYIPLLWIELCICYVPQWYSYKSDDQPFRDLLIWKEIFYQQSLIHRRTHKKTYDV